MSLLPNSWMISCSLIQKVTLSLNRGPSRPVCVAVFAAGDVQDKSLLLLLSLVLFGQRMGCDVRLVAAENTDGGLGVRVALEKGKEIYRRLMWKRTSQVGEIVVSSTTMRNLPEPVAGKVDSVLNRMNKHGKKADNFAQGVLIPVEKIKESKSKCRYEEAIAKVYGNNYLGQLNSGSVVDFNFKEVPSFDFLYVSGWFNDDTNIANSWDQTDHQVTAGKWACVGF
ncbi:hypothetical protein EZV62_014252 [Acer yangbiense]|uniref:Uncharacterized protein n=1 Tax=Acer yangbiense TaxID=1000413 RepID=A0A5C7HSA2_9ROSI|nr:hypothetical protein EZV62_014252 [Acer yangbiense]